MPTKRRVPKKRRATKMNPVTRHVLQYGYGGSYNYYRKLAEDYGEDGVMDHIIETKVTSSLERIWHEHRDEILELWRSSGKPGKKCWGERAWG